MFMIGYGTLYVAYTVPRKCHYSTLMLYFLLDLKKLITIRFSIKIRVRLSLKKVLRTHIR